MKKFFRSIKKFFQDVGELIARIGGYSTIEKYAKQLIDLAAFFGLISSEARDRLKRGIDAGEDLVLDGVAKFENIVLSIDELVGALKLLLAEVFPKSDARTLRSTAPRGFTITPASERASFDILATHAGVDVPGSHLSYQFQARTRGVSTAEFIELCEKLRAERERAS